MPRENPQYHEIRLATNIFIKKIRNKEKKNFSRFENKEKTIDNLKKYVRMAKGTPRNQDIDFFEGSVRLRLSPLYHGNVIFFSNVVSKLTELLYEIGAMNKPHSHLSFIPVNKMELDRLFQHWKDATDDFEELIEQYLATVGESVTIRQKFLLQDWKKFNLEYAKLKKKDKEINKKIEEINFKFVLYPHEVTVEVVDKSLSTLKQKRFEISTGIGNKRKKKTDNNGILKIDHGYLFTTNFRLDDRQKRTFSLAGPRFLQIPNWGNVMRFDSGRGNRGALRKGEKGKDVLILAQSLCLLRYIPGIYIHPFGGFWHYPDKIQQAVFTEAVDKQVKFDLTIKNLVKAFQNKNKDWKGDRLDASGEVDALTADAICRALVGVVYDRHVTPIELTKGKPDVITTSESFLRSHGVHSEVYGRSTK